jgi:hypothetical protein
MALKLFDLDLDLKQDSYTKDLKELYNIDVINQSIDIFLTTPYRIGKGFTNSLFDKVFTDINFKNNIDIARDLEEEFTINYQLLKINDITIESDTKNRRIFVRLDWAVKDFGISGNYSRYWTT